MTGFLITWRGVSLRKLSQIAGRMISGSSKERSFKRVSAMLINLSCLSQKVLDDRTECERGEESQRPDDDDDADEQHDEKRSVGREGAQAFRHRFLTDERAGHRHRGNDHQETPSEHRQTETHVVPGRICVQAGKGGTIVARGAAISVENLTEPVRASVI